MTSVEERPAPPAVQPATAPSLPASMARMLLAPALGAVLGFLLLVKVVLPTVGVGGVERIVALGNHLDASLAPPPVVALLGNSITREGIDARIVEAHAPSGWHAQNLATSGCGLSEMRVLVPKLMAAHPAAVAIGLRPEDLGRVDDFDIDKAYAYALGGFVAAWPADWTRADLPGVTEATYAALRSTPFEQNMHFRTALLNVINQQVRLRLRKGDLREIAPDNWTDPYELTFNVRDERLDRHARTTREQMDARLAGGAGTGATLIATLAAEIRRAGAMPILVALPLHPLLRDGMEPHVAAMQALMARVAREQSGLTIDAIDVLSANDFADVLHPNREGREIYSRFLGERLPPPAATEKP
ncbi:MAG: hypothetical protein HYX69_05700 [Planctomycetia bacterium]|nr:hypothetical protein [Planctomycetia bacterium]